MVWNITDLSGYITRQIPGHITRQISCYIAIQFISSSEYVISW